MARLAGSGVVGRRVAVSRDRNRAAARQLPRSAEALKVVPASALTPAERRIVETAAQNARSAAEYAKRCDDEGLFVIAVGVL